MKNYALQLWLAKSAATLFSKLILQRMGICFMIFARTKFCQIYTENINFHVEQESQPQMYIYHLLFTLVTYRSQYNHLVKGIS